MKQSTAVTKSVRIEPPKFQRAVFRIRGTAPLVIKRMSMKTQNGLADKAIAGSTANSKKKREAQDPTEVYNQCRYIAKEGWDGFNATSIRNAMISACRLVNFKMTLAKLSIFVEEDGRDKDEPQIPLVRIYGEPIMQRDVARVQTGQPYIIYRPAYHEWYANVKIRWDADQFTVEDVSNLLSRVGQQGGIGEGRPDSKNSAGMGWGLFSIEGQNSEDRISRKRA